MISRRGQVPLLLSIAFAASFLSLSHLLLSSRPLNHWLRMRHEGHDAQKLASPLNGNVQAYFLHNKTVYIAGNSIYRGLYFGLSALLRSPVAASNSSPPNWEDRVSQKLLCNKESSWPPKPSCTAHTNETNTSLVNTWTQRMTHLNNHLNMSFSTFHPDVTFINIGLDHVSVGHEKEWQRDLNGAWPMVASRINLYFNHHPSARLIWSPVFHFNETACRNKRLTNRGVDTWNQMLLDKFVAESWLDKEWFTWHTSQADIMDKALANRDGLGMDDWVHPNSKTTIALLNDLIQTYIISLRSSERLKSS